MSSGSSGSSGSNGSTKKKSNGRHHSTELMTVNRMELLERRAKVARARLFRAVDELDERRHKVVEVAEKAKELVTSATSTRTLTIVGIAALLGSSAIALGLVVRAVHRRRSLSYRISRRISKAIRDLDLDLVPQPPSLGRRVFDRLTLTLISVATTEIARRGILLEGGRLRGLLAAPQQQHDSTKNESATSFVSRSNEHGGQPP